MGDPTARIPGQRFRNPAAMSPSASAPDSQTDAAVPEQAPTPKLQRYQAARRPVVLLVALVLLGVIAGLIYIGTKPAGNDPVIPSNTPSPTSTRTPPPGGFGVEFQSSSGNVGGYWEILEWEWDSQGVLITMRITLDVGDSLQFEWFAFDNANAGSWYPDAHRSTIATGTVYRGDPVTGTVYFNVPRGKLTVYLCDKWGMNFTGLVVPE
ncbi:MAG: hypothetical protein LBH11_05795 [Propionibacteriaceae bacterium]|jgi:hypothetical protein|nr:hypothetical protein [Propionibacteriaceae bacterium]